MKYTYLMLIWSASSPPLGYVGNRVAYIIFKDFAANKKVAKSAIRELNWKQMFPFHIQPKCVIDSCTIKPAIQMEICNNKKM